MHTSIIIPLLNPNEPEAMLTAIHVSEGQQVTAGQPLCTLETTKSSVDLEAEVDGFVVELFFRQGQIAHAGDTLCYLAEDPTWKPPEAEAILDRRVEGKQGEQGRYGKPGMQGDRIPEGIPPKGMPPKGMRITEPALALANQLGLDLEQLPTDRLVTESMVRTFQRNQPMLKTNSFLTNVPPIRTQNPLIAPAELISIIIYGGGGHGKTLIDLLRTLGCYRIVGLIDDGVQAGEEVMGLPVLGGSEILLQLRAQGIELAINAVGGIGNLGTRIQVFQNLVEAGFVCPAVIHPSAVVEDSAVLAEGVQVFAHAYVGSEAQIGFGCIVNTGAIVSHDCQLGDFTNVSPGAMLAGEVHLGACVLVGMGATINLQVNISAGARIGNGATIKEDVPENAIVRAGTVWPKDGLDSSNRRII